MKGKSYIAKAIAKSLVLASMICMPSVAFSSVPEEPVCIPQVRRTQSGNNSRPHSPSRNYIYMYYDVLTCQLTFDLNNQAETIFYNFISIDNEIIQSGTITKEFPVTECLIPSGQYQIDIFTDSGQEYYTTFKVNN